MFIKASLALLLLVSVRAQTTGPCADNTFICSDCTALDACFGGTRYPITCTAGQVCGNDGTDPNIDGCFDSTDSSNTKQSQCSCDASATDPTYIADGLSEDPAAYLACLPGSSAPESLVCLTDEIFLEGQIPPCGAAPPTTPAASTTEPPTTPAPFECSSVLSTGESGFVADPNVCSTYWLCASDTDTSPTEANCAAGESFNQATLACFDPCDPSAQTFSCDGITGGVADSIDCTIFHICVNGAVVGVPVPCADNEIFDGTGCVTGTACPSATNECLICPTTVAPSTVSGASGATSGSGSSTDGSDSSTDGSESSTVDSGSSTDGSDSSTTDSDPSTPDSDSSTSDSGSGSSTSESDSSASGSDSSTESPSIPTTAPGVTGVPDCSTASQAGYYANSASCNVFYSCEDDDAGGYVLKEYTCPGSLVFDPVNNYCNLASLVPGC